MTAIPTIDVHSFAQRRQTDRTIFLLDVREPHEYAHCTIEGAVLIPLGQLPNRLDEVPKDRPVVVTCHHGGRSARAVQFLLSQGLADVHNLAGGIDLWALEVDSTVPRY